MVKPEVDEDGMTAVMDRVRRVVGEHSGEIVDEDDWGKRKLAYKIGAIAEAKYYLAHLSMEGDGTTALDTSLKHTENVIRHLLIRRD